MGYDIARTHSVETFWRYEDGYLKMRSYLIIICGIGALSIGALAYITNASQNNFNMSVLSNIGGDNPCITLYSENYVVIDTWYSVCKKVVTHYLDEKGFKPMSDDTFGVLTEDRVVLSRGALTPSALNMSK